jgi:hypothetical protein
VSLRGKGECLHLFLLGVAQTHAGRGIGHGLVAGLSEARRPRGFHIAVTEATNSTSQHIFRKQGFVERVRRSYLDHRFDDRAYFASIAEEHIGPILFDKAPRGFQNHESGSCRRAARPVLGPNTRVRETDLRAWRGGPRPASPLIRGLETESNGDGCGQTHRRSKQ